MVKQLCHIFLRFWETNGSLNVKEKNEQIAKLQGIIMTLIVNEIA
jgi:hypothetical protein